MDRAPSFGGQQDESYTHPGPLGLEMMEAHGRRLTEMPAGTQGSQDKLHAANVLQETRLEKQLKGMLFTLHLKSGETGLKNKQTECNSVTVIME